VTFNRRRAATWLWVLFAFVAWNVIFDRVIIDAGREYVRAADAAVRQQAMFWLGQSNDPRALKFFEDVLLK
jgi:hypothetical protein